MKQSIERIIGMIRKMSNKDLRLGQIMTNVFDIAAKDGHDPYFISDEQLLQYFKKYMADDID